MGIGDGHDLKSPRFAGNLVLEACYDNESSLRKGDQGDAVKVLQRALMDSGYPLPTFGDDGDFGNETESAVKRYQGDRGLQADGIVGRKTMTCLDAEFLLPISLNSNQRMLDVMNRLVNTYHFPENGAAGLVGNLWEESGLLPNRIEGSLIQTPMRSQNFAGQLVNFTAVEVMNRNPSTQQGPRFPGIGLAQWTSTQRRTGLFNHNYQGQQLGACILFAMDAQIDYLVTELQVNFPAVNATLNGAGVSLNDASDDVVYRFEVPGSILDNNGHLLPRNDPSVQAVFTRRRASSQLALQIFRTGHP